MTTSAAPYPRNAEGVGLGSTQAEVLAAFPTAIVGSMVDLGAGDITMITVDDPVVTPGTSMDSTAARRP